MRRYVALLLATTALTHLVIAQARAGTVIESDLSPDGVFGSSFAPATPITPDVTDIVGNVDHYVQGFSNATNTPDFLDIQAAGYQAFHPRRAPASLPGARPITRLPSPRR
jgi:hypothetical protein